MVAVAYHDELRLTPDADLAKLEGDLKVGFAYHDELRLTPDADLAKLEGEKPFFGFFLSIVGRGGSESSRANFLIVERGGSSGVRPDLGGLV